ncbi:hypothetical protein [Mesorhizobium sp.]|uniref:hypothetical protein n=1 Tax=Mesorhizobium sp. TaxID=1871066 RepID=UPI000FE57BEC|nr:hypothetical protein [Mesorhizobium sp.]RWD69525.1 MAG: hypothetical protein EOS37_17880 [Mesorhizobium sp.]TIV59827.1 MAG: hypothetical protein E5V80_12225 [Mesorhizobium sp.]
MTGKKAQTGQKPKTAQIDKFRELAREIETVDSEEPLNAAIRKVAKVPPPPNDKKSQTRGR